MTEQMLEIRSALDPHTNQPKLGDCTLALGDGSVKVKFENGRGVASRAVCEQYLVNNGDIEIPALGILRQSTGGAMTLESQTLQSVTVESNVKAIEDMTPEELREHAAKLAELLAATADAKDAEEPKDDDDGKTPESRAAEQQRGAKTTVDEAATEGSEPVRETEQERQLREAAEHLREEGEDVPDPDPAALRVVPDGFDDRTAEGDLRCLAKTASGGQCKNAAQEGSNACSIAAHQEQLNS